MFQNRLFPIPAAGVALAVPLLVLMAGGSAAQSCIDKEKALKAQIDAFDMQSYKAPGAVDYDICRAMTDLTALVADHTGHLEDCPDADPTGEQRAANRTWMAEMDATRTQFCG